MNRIYLDMNVLAALCGAPVGDAAQADAVRRLLVLLDSDHAPALVLGYVHERELSAYRNAKRRACIRRVLRRARVEVSRELETEVHRMNGLRSGLSDADAAHCACARVAGAVLLTFDKRLLDFARQRKLECSAMSPLEWLAGSTGRKRGGRRQTGKGGSDGGTGS